MRAPTPAPSDHPGQEAASADPAARQARARAAGEATMRADASAKLLGIEVFDVAPGQACARMTVRPDMLNGFGICHGGLVATLADTAFAVACNSHDVLTVAAGFNLDLLAPSHVGDVLTARASEVWHSGRSGLYDVVVHNQHGRQVAAFRGRSHSIRGRSVTGDPTL